MFLGLVTVCFMFATVLVKSFTVVALREKRHQFAEASEGSGRARSRLKIAANESSIAEREIAKHRRKIKSSERRIAELEKKLGELNVAAQQGAIINQEKLRLSDEMQKKKGIV